MRRILIVCVFFLAGSTLLAEGLAIRGVLWGDSEGRAYGETIMRKLRAELDYIPDVSFHDHLGPDAPRDVDWVLDVDMSVLDVESGLAIFTTFAWWKPDKKPIENRPYFDVLTWWYTAEYESTTWAAEQVANKIDEYLQVNIPEAL